MARKRKAMQQPRGSRKGRVCDSEETNLIGIPCCGCRVPWGETRAQTGEESWLGLLIGRLWLRVLLRPRCLST